VNILAEMTGVGGIAFIEEIEDELAPGTAFSDSALSFGLGATGDGSAAFAVAAEFVLAAGVELCDGDGRVPGTACVKKVALALWMEMPVIVGEPPTCDGGSGGTAVCVISVDGLVAGKLPATVLETEAVCNDTNVDKGEFETAAMPGVETEVVVLVGASVGLDFSVASSTSIVLAGDAKGFEKFEAFGKFGCALVCKGTGPMLSLGDAKFGAGCVFAACVSDDRGVGVRITCESSGDGVRCPVVLGPSVDSEGPEGTRTVGPLDELTDDCGPTVGSGVSLCVTEGFNL
jgi:hypothetical protein